MMDNNSVYSSKYSKEKLNHIAYPLGGIGSGMICIEGTGAISHFSVRNRPDVFKEPCMFSAIHVKGRKNASRVLEGPVPSRKIFGKALSGIGSPGMTYGLPRFQKAEFEARFPFATVRLKDAKMPLEVEMTAWNPFIPGDADNSSLPVACIEYRFHNVSGKTLEAVYSFNSRNVMAVRRDGHEVLCVDNGFILHQSGTDKKPYEQGDFCAVIDNNSAVVNCAWFRGGWFDPLSTAWKDIEEGDCPSRGPVTEGEPSPGASVFLPLNIAPGEIVSVRLLLSWYVPYTNLRYEENEENVARWEKEGVYEEGLTHKPWYAGRFASIEEVAAYWRTNCSILYEKTRIFTECFYNTTLPAEVVEAVSANLTILKSTTTLRQTDGRLWCYEGTGDTWGSCHGSCTHVWNYAQAIPHLFPELERSMRQTEFNESQDERGHQIFRSNLPIRPSVHEGYAAADGQLGGIIKLYRDWRICGDIEWLKSLWPKAKKSLDYCIETWDPRHQGQLEEPHHNTYDIEFWGPDSMCSGIYLAALKAGVLIGEVLGDDMTLYSELYNKTRCFYEEELFNGEYFEQKVRWKGLQARNPLENAGDNSSGYSPEAVKLIEKEGPKYQYGTGCLSDQLLGVWLANVCGLEDIADKYKVRRALSSIYKNNLKKDLSEHANPQRPGFAAGKEGGLLLCTWPRGGRTTLPFPYSDEVWTGIEYQAASHLIMEGFMEEGLDIVRTCRKRYDGGIRNPFNEYECGHWYARALSSYSLIQSLTGIRYDAVDRVLFIKPKIKGDFRAFTSTVTGFGTAGIKHGKPFIQVKHGHIDVKRIECVPAE